MQSITYLFFRGNCREAMNFYRECLDGHLDLTPYDQEHSPQGLKTPEGIMHARLTVGAGEAFLMASDMPPSMPCEVGSNFSVSVACDSSEQVDKLFQAFGVNGKVTMPLANMFWGAYFGSLTDRFGINWMFNYERPKQA